MIHSYWKTVLISIVIILCLNFCWLNLSFFFSLLFCTRPVNFPHPQSMNPLNTQSLLYPHIFAPRRGKKERPSTHSCLSLAEDIVVDRVQWNATDFNRRVLKHYTEVKEKKWLIFHWINIWNSYGTTSPT